MLENATQKIQQALDGVNARAEEILLQSAKSAQNPDGAGRRAA